MVHLTYFIDGKPLCSTTAEKDLGVMVDQNLKFHQHAAAVATKANRILGLISKCFEHLDVDSLPILYKTLVHPILDFANSVWGPALYHRSENVRKSIEESHQTCTFFEGIAYAECLSQLKLSSLYYRRKQGDMILEYQTLHGLVNVDSSFFLSPTTYTNTRGHNFKLHKEKFAKAYTFLNRVIDDWNSLPDYIVNADSLTPFKNLLNKYWTDYHYFYND